MAQRVRDRLVRRVACEDVLRDQRIDDDDDGERERERIRKKRTKRKLPRTECVDGDAREGYEQQHVLPRLDRGERVPVNTGAVQRVHRRVVQREPDDEHVERDDRASPDEGRRHGEHKRVDDECERGHFASRRKRSRLKRYGASGPVSVATIRRCARASPSSSSRRVSR